MVNWENIKKIHVIRKLQAILGQWFQTDVYIVDNRGVIRNLDRDNLQLKNPFAKEVVRTEAGREKLFSAIATATEQVQAQDQNLLVVDGPFGFEKAIAAKVIADSECLGVVYVYGFIEKKATEAALKPVLEECASLGIDLEMLQDAVNHLKPIQGEDLRYHQELVGLVAEEIVTFHTEISKREEKINTLNTQLGERYSYDSMIGKAKPMQDLYEMLDKIKNSESTVLIQGENGTGKELIAKAVHFNSSRKDGQFLTVNCSAFNENLLDSELFGHVKGAFTGAVRDKKGLFEAAHRGTLFLDEIGDMSPTMQVKLLRVLQEGTLTPVGGTEVRKVDVRVLAATNRDLKDMIEKGTFREDLYYRVNVINLQVPPLRDRKEDIPLLVEHFINRGCSAKKVAAKTLHKRVMERLFDYPWPGNIRELENEMERVIVLAGDDPKISVDLLSQRIREHGENAKVQGVRVAGKLKDALEELEKTMIREGLRRTNWNKSRLAKELGISRAGLIMKVEKYGLDKRKLARAS